MISETLPPKRWNILKQNQILSYKQFLVNRQLQRKEKQQKQTACFTKFPWQDLINNVYLLKAQHLVQNLVLLLHNFKINDKGQCSQSCNRGKNKTIIQVYLLPKVVLTNDLRFRYKKLEDTLAETGFNLPDLNLHSNK